MAAETWINDGGVARQIREVWVNDSGVARRIQEIWVNDSGTARRIFVGDQVAVSDTTVAAMFAGTTTAVFMLSSTGDIWYNLLNSNTIADRGDWITPQTNMANYEARVDMLSGSLTTGTVGAYQNLGTDRSWTLTRPSASGSGTSTCSFTLSIRRASDASVVDTATITLGATIP